MESLLNDESRTYIQAAINAVTIQLSSKATPTERQNAANYTENLKKDSRAIHYAFLLMHPSLESPVRMYGLSILEYHIKTSWNAGGIQEGAPEASSGNFGVQQAAPIELTPKHKESLQSSILNLLSMGTRGILEEDAYVKEKSCAVAVEMAKRSWPNEWKHLMHNLILRQDPSHFSQDNQTQNGQSSASIIFQGDSQLELVVKFFKIFAEELGSLCSLPSSRRKMLTHLLSSLAKYHLFPILYQQLEIHYSYYQQYCSPHHGNCPFDEEQLVSMLPGHDSSSARQNPSYHPQLHSSIIIINEILHTLIAFAEWLPLESFLECGGTPTMTLDPSISINTQSSSSPASSSFSKARNQPSKPSGATSKSPTFNLGPVVVLLMREIPFRLKCAELLLVMVSRPRPERDHMIFLFEHIPIFSESLDSVPPTKIVDEVWGGRYGTSNAPCFLFSRRLCQTLCMLGQIHLDFLNFNKPPANLDQFMAIMLSISSHPSQQLAVLASTFWKRILTLPLFHRQTYFVSMCETLLMNMSFSFVKWPYELEGAGLVPAELKAFRQLDFEEDEETFYQFQAEARNNISKSILTPIALHLPLTAFSFAHRQWQICIEMHDKLVQEIGNDQLQAYHEALEHYGSAHRVYEQVFNLNYNSHGGQLSRSSDGTQPNAAALLNPASMDAIQTLISLFESVSFVTSIFNEQIGPQSLMQINVEECQDEYSKLLFRRGRAIIQNNPNSSKSSKYKKSNNNPNREENARQQDDEESKAKLLEIQSTFCESSLLFNPAFHTLIPSQIELSKSFLSFYAINPHAMHILLDKMMNMVIYKGWMIEQAQQAQPDSLISPDPISLSHYIKDIRKKACTSLINVGMKLPFHLVEHLSKILEMIGNWTNSNSITPSEIIHLMDWVSCLSNALSPEAQESFLSNLIAPQVSEWQSQTITFATQSVHHLLAFIGIPQRLSNRQRKMLNQGQKPTLKEGEVEAASKEDSIQNRKLLSTLVQNFDAVWRRVANRGQDGSVIPIVGTVGQATLSEAQQELIDQHRFSSPLAQFDLSLLLNLLRLIALMNQLNDDEIKELYMESCPGVFKLDYHMTRAWLRSNNQSNQSNHSYSLFSIEDDMDELMMEESSHQDAINNSNASSSTHSTFSPVEDSHINHFVNQLRSMSFSLLGSIISHVSPIFTDSPELLESFNAAILSYHECSHPVHLSIILKKVIAPSIKVCPPHAFPYLIRLLEPLFHHVGSLVSRLYRSHKTVMAEEASKSVAGGISSLLKSNSSNTYGSSSTSTEDEIIQDRAIVELLLNFSSIVQSSIISKHATINAGKSSKSKKKEEDSTSEYDGYSGQSLMDDGGMYQQSINASNYDRESSTNSILTPLFVHLLRCSNGASHWLLTCVVGIFEWGEPSSTRRMCNVVESIVEALKRAEEDRLLHPAYNPESSPIPPDDPTTTSHLAGPCLRAVLAALDRQSEHAGLLVSVARDLFLLQPNQASQIFSQLPNVTHIDIQKLNKDMSHQASARAKAGTIKEFLEKVVKWNLTPQSAIRTQATKILDVPPNLFAQHLAQRQKAAKEKQALDEQEKLGLASLFNSP